jgi:hypothetical protein
MVPVSRHPAAYLVAARAHEAVRQTGSPSSVIDQETLPFFAAVVSHGEAKWSGNVAWPPARLPDHGSLPLPRSRRLVGITTSQRPYNGRPRILSIPAPDTSGGSPAYTFALCTSRTCFCLTATAYPHGNLRERAERPIFYPDREQLWYGES